jgi:hypothetical protein
LLGSSLKGRMSLVTDLLQHGAVTLRPAAAADAERLIRLAQLDSRSLPPGPHLIAERDGTIEATISLRTGEVVANPFVRTAELCEHLRLHAKALAGTTISARKRGLYLRPLGAPA